VDVENWRCNSGLTGFAQNISDQRISVLEIVALEHDFEIVAKMVSVLRKYFDEYGRRIIDLVTDDEFNEIGQ